MDLSEFDYRLPPDLIAQHPVERRDESRLMVIDRATGSIDHARFRDLAAFLMPSDLLVLNNSRVIPARLLGRKFPGQATIEILLLRQQAPDLWECLIRPGRRCPPGTVIRFASDSFEAVAGEEISQGRRLVRFRCRGELDEWIERVGRVPLPPYIHREDDTPDQEDRLRYQTVYAVHPGSVAAPTAGLHLTPELLRNLRHCALTLHIGYGTFRPIQSEEVEDHRMDPEIYSIEPEAAGLISRQIEDGNRIVAVGSTSTRVLEHVWAVTEGIHPGTGETALFIYPGFRFRVVNALVTNFHLPKSTLLLLVAAFGGRELMLEAYRIAVAMKYRFYSYGDAMLIR